MANNLTLTQIRTLTRLALDLEEEDLDDTLIDSWAQEGFDLAIATETAWNFYAVSIPYTTSPDVQTIEMDTLTSASAPTAALEKIYSIRGERWNLQPVAARLAESAFRIETATTREPNWWSQQGRTLSLWPIPDDAYDLIISGYRRPLDWITLGGAAAVPDCPAEFHRVILSWVMSKAYLQQDDPGTAQVHELQFGNQLKVLIPRFTAVPDSGPFIMNKGEVPGGPLDRLFYDWE